MPQVRHLLSLIGLNKDEFGDQNGEYQQGNYFSTSFVQIMSLNIILIMHVEFDNEPIQEDHLPPIVIW